MVPRESGFVFKFCDAGHIFGGSEGLGSRFHVCAPSLFLGVTEGVRSHFHVLCS
jgi:hypothetical protein